jgi:uncharacterized protein YegL
MTKLPGGALASRPLHFFWLVDCSGSMAGDKIERLNFAIREAIPEMQKVAAENPNAQVFVRALTFANGAKWHVGQPTPVQSFQWQDIKAGGVTDMGRALRTMADALSIEQMPARGLPPVLVLISDGQPTDDFNSGLKALMDQPWGKKAVRIAIAIGDDADHDILQKFIGHAEMTPLSAHNPADLVRFIKWASTVVLKAASSPATQTPVGSASAVAVPVPVAPDPTDHDDDVW